MSRRTSLHVVASAIVAAFSACGGLVSGSHSDDGAVPLATDRPSADAQTNADAGYEDVSDAARDATFDVWCEAGRAVPVCVEYFAVLTSCFKHDYGTYACADPLVPKVDADVSRVERACARYLKESGHACR